VATWSCPLHPPRSTFPADMSEAEAALMGEHGAYWQALAERGSAVVVGPVIDPAGIFGLAVLEAEGLDEARRLTDEDPVVRAGAGFRYDVLPILQPILRGA
jgi:uncharacterized protein